ncbi:hypothetical protein CNECB9_2470016 [Cupriavidus necator]|uniref:Uncharacterized protein n=1 Tax=Cupriavidus necator TaxID=106590 RepID=A0A1K0IFJ3_CUPNE|nr:hypothetical protein CNECB9_2470016 [Cupriavidus necator]
MGWFMPALLSRGLEDQTVPKHRLTGGLLCRKRPSCHQGIQLSFHHFKQAERAEACFRAHALLLQQHEYAFNAGTHFMQARVGFDCIDHY